MANIQINLFLPPQRTQTAPEGIFPCWCFLPARHIWENKALKIQKNQGKHRHPVISFVQGRQPLGDNHVSLRGVFSPILWTFIYFLMKMSMSEHCGEQGFPSQNLSISSVEGRHSLWMLKGNETANVIQIKESVFVFPLLIEQNWPRQHPHQPSGHISLKRLHFCKISSKNMQDLGKEVHYQKRKIFLDLQHLGPFTSFFHPSLCKITPWHTAQEKHCWCLP